jgi:CheY-like chemotaxis protein
MSSSISDSEKSKHGTIVYADDCPDDQLIFELALSEAGIKNKVTHLRGGAEVLKFLRETKEMPFMIISDVNMHGMDGFALKAEIEKDKELSLKAIPFIYLSTSTSRKDVKTAFYHQAQGYFEKPAKLKDLVRVLKLITEYWIESELPSYY